MITTAAMRPVMVETSGIVDAMIKVARAWMG